MPGVLAYMPSRPPANAASPAPAMMDGTKGSSSAEPSVISAAARSFAKSSGLSLLRNGYVPAANPCSRAARSSSAFHLPRPALSMNAPVTIRGGRWRALTGSLIDLLPDAAFSRSHCLPAAGEVTAQVNVPRRQAWTTPAADSCSDQVGPLVGNSCVCRDGHV